MNLDLENLISEIENDFDCGMKVFINKTNFKIISLPNFDDSFFEENEIEVPEWFIGDGYYASTTAAVDHSC